MEERMATMNLNMTQRQTQAVSPRLQHAVRLLQMSSLDFAALVRDALNSNPFLEAEEGVEADAAAESPAAQADDDDARAGTPMDLAGEDRDLWRAESMSGTTRPADDDEFSAFERTPLPTTLADHLRGQLNVLPLPARDLALASALAVSLDDDGYLRAPLEDLVDAASIDPPPAEDELMIALRRVQALDPAGVGARNVGECLMLQLPGMACPQLRALATTIVGEHLDALAARDVHGLSRALGTTVERAEAACDAIRRLNPRPGWRFGSSQVDYVVPDVLVKKRRGEWRVSLNPALLPRVRLNEVYAALFLRHRCALHAEMARHLQEARWTLRNVEQRYATILDVAQAIVRRQQHFFDFGAMAMKPLALRDIAQELGVHESTVSRVTNNKFMATPVGVFEMKRFFSRAMLSANGRACSGTAIRGLIEEMIQAEPARAPLSDAAICRQLAEQGLEVARRTVTKYRQLLRIEAVERRRRHA
jgi:RNA polymerase sigma-54 factor